jgi:phytoene dehydrogenase-like protein
VTLSSLARWDVGEPWDQRRARQKELMLDELEGMLPGFREHLLFAECATPATLERYCRNAQGAIYGWATTPGQIASKRLAGETPVPGLYLSGHWSETGPGSFRAIIAGVKTASAILEKAGRGGGMPDFRPRDVPPADSWKASPA